MHAGFSTRRIPKMSQDGVVDAQDALLAIDAAEKLYEIAQKEVQKYSPQFRAAVGFGTLLYARSFPYTIMFLRAFQVASPSSHPKSPFVYY